jgi:hypothetical protein
MIEKDPLFTMFHRYNKLVRRQMVKPLECGACGSILSTGLGEDDELVLNCFACDSTRVPGLATIDRVNAVVKEHFID